MSYTTGGEPAPPGYESDLPNSAVIASQIVNHKGGPLVGSEYVIELHEEGQQRPDYYCVLCNTCNDFRSIFTHWSSIAHRTNYVKKHFKKAYDVAHQLRRTSSNCNELIEIAVNKLMQSLEMHFGRNTQILTVAGNEFRRHRNQVCSQVRAKVHFNETMGRDFVNDMRKIIKDARNAESQHSITLDAISSDDDIDGGALASQSSTKKGRKLMEDQQQQPAYRLANRSPSGTGDKTTKSAPIAAKQTFASSKEPFAPNAPAVKVPFHIEKFRCMYQQELKQLVEETVLFEENPEKHPEYSDEWKLFWNRRYKQLQEEKKCDPNSYDYKPEWISYWKERSMEVFKIAMEKLETDLKQKLNLAYDADAAFTNEFKEHYKKGFTSLKDMLGIGTGAARRKPNYRGANNRAGSNAADGPDGGGDGNGGICDSVIDISDEEQPSSQVSQARPMRRPPYNRSMSRSPSPSRGGRPHGRRSRSRSPMLGRRRHGRSRSGSITTTLRSSRSPYTRIRDKSRHSRGRDDYGVGLDRDRDRDRDRERDRPRERNGSDFYRDRGESYSRSQRNFSPMETFRIIDSRLYPEYNKRGGKSGTGPPSTVVSGAAVHEPESPEQPEGPLTVVSVLRMMSAVEEHLGSLGPKALSLLSKALAMEKVKPNAADDLLLNEDNCVFLETTKEKLKGILIAEVLEDPQKVRVVKKLISNIAAIIHQVNDRAGSQAGAWNSTAQQDSSGRKQNYQLPFDRELLSSKLANALVSNGIDNVSIEDMDRLAHFFALLVKNNAERPVYEVRLNWSEVQLRMGLCQVKEDKDWDVDADSRNVDEDLRELLRDIDSPNLLHDLVNQLSRKNSKEISFIDVATAIVNSGDSVDANGGAVVSAGAEGNGGAEVDSVPGLESLSDPDLQTLLQNFKILTSEEQTHIIRLLRVLEVSDKARVARLRKYVNVNLTPDGESCSSYLTRVAASSQNRPIGLASSASASSSSSGIDGARFHGRERDLSGSSSKAYAPSRPVLDDDDDDDYNFDDLLKTERGKNNKHSTSATSSSDNGRSQVPMDSTSNVLTYKPASSRVAGIPRETENIIANLMGTLTSNISSTSPKSQPLGTGLNSKQAQKRKLLPEQTPQHQQHQQQFGRPINDGGGGAAGGGGGGAGGMSAPFYNFEGRGDLSNANFQQKQMYHMQREMGNYAAYAPSMIPGGIEFGGGGAAGGGGGSYGGVGGPYGGGQMNPWANGTPQSSTYNTMPQDYMLQQQQQQQQQPQEQQPQQHYNMFLGN